MTAARRAGGADLPLQQPQHQAEQRQLDHQRTPRHQLGLLALAGGLLSALCQQLLLAGLQFLHQPADRITRAQVLHQLALVTVGL